MKIKVFYENNTGTMGGWEYMSAIKLIFCILTLRLRVKEKSTNYYIKKIEYKGARI